MNTFAPRFLRALFLLYLGLSSAYAGTGQADNPANPIEIGPINFSLGPQDDGHLGIVTKGDSVGVIPWITGTRPLCRKPGPYARPMGYHEFKIDAGWSAAPEASNSTTIGIRIDAGWALGIQPDYDRKQCLGRQRVQTTKPLDIGDDGLGSDAREGIFGEPGRLSSKVESTPAPNDLITFLPFIDYSYRDISIAGGEAQSSVRQQIIGGGFSLWYTAKLPEPLREWPRLYVGYFHPDTADAEQELPAGVKADHLSAEFSLKTFIPFLSSRLRASPLLLDLDLRYSRAINAGTGKDEFFGTVHLLYNNKKSIKPALVYRFGDDRGVDVDEQLIAGVVWNLAAP